jgi:nucleoid DNA-binding protein
MGQRPEKHKAGNIMIAAMRKNDLTAQVARKSDLPEAAAADRIDEVVHDLIKRLRKGQTAALPGLGKLRTRQPQSPRRRSRGAGKGDQN